MALQDTNIEYLKTSKEIIRKMTIQQIIAWIRHSDILITAQQKKEKQDMMNMNITGYLEPKNQKPKLGVESGLHTLTHDSGIRRIRK